MSQNVELKQNTEPNLTGTALKVAVFQKPYIQYRLNMELLYALQFVLNFTYIIVGADDWGTYNATKREWNGIIGQILAGQVDIAVTTTADIPIRRTVVDFTQATNSFHYNALFRIPGIRRDALAQVRPFRNSLWVAVILWGSTLSIAFVFIHCPNSWSNISAALRQLLEGIIHTIAIACGHGLAQSPRGHQKILALASALTGFALSAAYSGVLYSFLSLESGDVKLEALHSSSFTFAVDARIMFLLNERIKEAPPSYFRIEYYRRPKITADHLDIRTMQRVVDGSWVALVYNWVGNNMLSSGNERCSIGMTKLPIAEQPCGLMVPKNSSYKRPVDFQILKVKERGLNALWLKRYLPTSPACNSLGKYEAVPFKSTLVAVYGFLCGFIFSMLVLVVEKIVNFMKA